VRQQEYDVKLNVVGVNGSDTLSGNAVRHILIGCVAMHMFTSPPETVWCLMVI